MEEGNTTSTPQFPQAVRKPYQPTVTPRASVPTPILRYIAEMYESVRNVK